MGTKEMYFAKNTIILFSSKFFTQFLSLLILPIITSSVSKNIYGEFDLISTYAFLIVSFMSLKIENGIFRFLIDVRENEDSKSKIITNGFCIIFVQLMVFAILYFVVSFFFRFELQMYIFFFALFSLIFSLFLEIARGLGKNIDYALASLISGSFNLVFNLLFLLYLNLGLKGLVLSGILSNLIGATYIFMKNNVFRYISFNFFDKKTMTELLNYSFPLVPNSLSSWILSISDKLMISFFIGTVANGIYAISTKFSVLLSHVYGVFNLSWIETISLNIKNEDNEIFVSKMFNKIFFLCFSICILMIAAMPLVFKILIDKEFYEAYYYIPFLIIGVIFEIFSGLLGGIYTSLMLSKKVAITTIFSGIMNMIINLIFMGKYGIIVACLSTIVSYLIISIYRFWDIRNYIKIKLNYRDLLIALLFLVVCVLLYYSNSVLCFILNMIITIIYIFILNKEIIYFVFKKVCNKK